MSRNFRSDLSDPDRFIITMELVPKAESTGRSINTVLEFSKQALNDGRLSAVSITDNPGGNPSLSPDVLGKEILDSGIDVIVHVTCRDMNRMGIESRALQLRRMGMNNILALTGDYSGKGFGGQGAPVFDLDSVNLLCFFNMMNQKSEDSDHFFKGCAVSPFKWTEPECYAQYYKLRKKISTGADFIITQLGYDARKYYELIQFLKNNDLKIPALASVYLLTPRVARVMNSGRIPGTVVSKELYMKILEEWKSDKRTGYFASVDRAAKLAAICKGLGYRGIHIGGIHRNFKTVKRILDRMAEIENSWQDFLKEFDYSQPDHYYMYEKNKQSALSSDILAPKNSKATSFHKLHFKFLHSIHNSLFSINTPHAAIYKKISRQLYQNSGIVYHLVKFFEDVLKKILLNCQQCGDCGIEYPGFLCPESGCPKHMRNGACGGSRKGKCEVYPDRFCIWYLAYQRFALIEKTENMATACAPPRMWELNKTSSWINFHLGRDHHTKLCSIAGACNTGLCSPKKQTVKTDRIK
ncbi:MAG: methylenetetrahydrofolate reductase [Desulfobacterium sp.]|nr:methylenetetrahydrofolate reductase [Desulfobacterium sp.]MBU3948517.1 methylenetetrahydrofolate reductase C-terminal domain-containing protein [Pseudomonadota bacterium]MBU4037833.1 methylenetetrahydrofolate reductase C-terminal domain-containing protein [Pseudomonadota bacterium]